MAKRRRRLRWETIGRGAERVLASEGGGANTYTIEHPVDWQASGVDVGVRLARTWSVRYRGPRDLGRDLGTFGDLGEAKAAAESHWQGLPCWLRRARRPALH